MSFSRNDIKDFIKNFNEASWSDEDGGGVRLLSECECEDSEMSVGDAVPYDKDYSQMTGLFGAHQMDLSSTAPCPDSYNIAVDAVVTVPHELVQMLMPMMQEYGIGCPASLAKAMADVLAVSQENGITPVFSVE